MVKWFAAGLILALVAAPPVRAQGTASSDPKFEGKPVSAWLKDLAGKNEDAHGKAAAVLAAAGKDAVPALARALQDKSAALRERAAEVLGLIGEDAREAVPALLTALKDKAEA